LKENDANGNDIQYIKIKIINEKQLNNREWLLKKAAELEQLKMTN